MMKIELQWDLSMFGKMFGECESVGGMFRRITQKYVNSSTVYRSTIRTPPKTALYRQIPVNVHEYNPITDSTDLFSAQLAACRYQKWWEQETPLPVTETCSHDDEEYHRGSESSGRSLSIREIRKRMNSTQSLASNLTGPREFEPGLKFVDGIRGGWKDMEMFID
jgi:hypothetical protein